MRTIRTIVSATAAAAIATPAVLVSAAGPASAHGTMDTPVSRSYVCYQEGPENPVSDVCSAVVAAGGTQPLYDWMEVNIGDAAGRHREIIPDGRLCSAGRAKYSGLDLAREDWPVTSLPSSADFTFRYRATAPHQGGFELFVTRDGYDPSEPLRWDDLEPEPFHVEDSPRLVDGHYLMDVALPEKQGRHLIYAIWQRTDSPEAFYACSDVVFEGGAASDGPDDSGPGVSDGNGASEGDADTGGEGQADDQATCGSAEAEAQDESAGHERDGGSDMNHRGDERSSGAEADASSDRSDHARFIGFWAKLFDWLDRFHQQAEASPGIDDDTVLTSSVVPAGGPTQSQGLATPQLVVGLVAATMGIALALARPLGRGRHRWQPAHSAKEPR
jgi:chitin-binding protein